MERAFGNIVNEMMNYMAVIYISSPTLKLDCPLIKYPIPAAEPAAEPAIELTMELAAELAVY